MIYISLPFPQKISLLQLYPPESQPKFCTVNFKHRSGLMDLFWLEINNLQSLHICLDSAQKCNICTDL